MSGKHAGKGQAESGRHVWGADLAREMGLVEGGEDAGTDGQGRGGGGGAEGDDGADHVGAGD